MRAPARVCYNPTCMIPQVKAALILVVSAILYGPTRASDPGPAKNEYQAPVVDPVINREAVTWTNRRRLLARRPHVVVQPKIRGDALRRAIPKEGIR